jgi:catechol 2,3-dioxygenase-like lactoylglutathione lyase family enzyme
MTILGIDTVAVVVSNRRKALRWYRDVLGLEVAFTAPEEGHWIEVGPGRPLTRLHICEMPKTEPGPTGITLLTEDIHAEYERLRSMGVSFRYPPRRMEWGEWMCAFSDPDGNEFDLKQPLDPSEWTC